MAADIIATSGPTYVEKWSWHFLCPFPPDDHLPIYVAPTPSHCIIAPVGSWRFGGCMDGFLSKKGAGTVALACGYGVVCGLVFPLMVQSVFLHEIGLAHGAGESFGLLFFIAYSVTMLLCAAFYGLAGGSRRGRISLDIGLAAAFAGNALMLARSLGAVSGGLPYSVAAAGLLGFGLALGELGWAQACSSGCEGRPMKLSRAISGSYLAGTAVSAVVFALSGAVELIFALIAIAASAFLSRFVPSPVVKAVPEKGGSGADLARSTAYLAVFSFVFGAVGQAGAAAGGKVPIQVLALLGMGAAAVIALVASAAARRVVPVADVDAAIFPVAAVALVALPLVAEPAARDISVLLLFAAFFLAGLNARVTACQLAWSSPSRAGMLVCSSLGVGGLAMLAGVAVGALVLSGGDLASGVYTVSIVSLFALSMTTFVYRELRDRRSAAASAEPAVAVSDPRAPHAALTQKLGLTAREAEVLELVCQGRSRTYIADELGLSPNTVKGYAHSLYQKAGVADKQSLIDLVRSEESTKDQV